MRLAPPSGSSGAVQPRDDRSPAGDDDDDDGTAVASEQRTETDALLPAAAMPPGHIHPTLSIAGFIAVSLALAGCNGGTVDEHALKQDRAAIDSLACEGRLLARDIADGDTVARFARAHAAELAKRASNFEDALSTRPTQPAIELQVRALAHKAGRVSLLLRRLEAHPGDALGAHRVERVLAGAGDCP